MNFVFLMDPLSSVHKEKDTSFILMVGAHHRGHKIFYLPDGGISLHNGKVYLRATEVVPQPAKSFPFLIKKTIVLSERDVDAVFLRTDPPFNEKYLMQTWLLERLPAAIPVVNRPAGVRAVNEKLWATQFTDLVPQTLVSRRREELRSFIKREKDVIAKPTDGHGGAAVFRIKQGDLNTNVILETLSRNFQKEIVIQKYIPAATQGDKRILLLNGELLGVVLRVHAKDDHRNNFFAGGKPKSCRLNKRDEQIILTLRPHLQRLGLYFVGIDILGDYLIEVNVTSPTCLQEMNRLYRRRLEDKVIAFVENLVAQRNKSPRIEKS